MKSTAQIKGHPLHPILVGFPIAFFTGALICDLIGYLTHPGDFYLFATWLDMAGVGFGVLAAIPGLIDYLFTVPPNSSAKSRATKHMLINVSNILLFSLALYLRHQPHVRILAIIGLELIGFSLLCVAGWMGATLVYRNQIGVYNRYASAGHPLEETVSEKDGKVKLKGIDELKVDQMKLFRVNGKRIVVGRTESGYVAFDDHCTHRGGSLAGGVLICGTVQCPWHGSQFDVKTGAVKAGPAKESIGVYEIVNGELRL